jgi:hypothetical protein
VHSTLYQDVCTRFSFLHFKYANHQDMSKCRRLLSYITWLPISLVDPERSFFCKIFKNLLHLLGTVVHICNPGYMGGTGGRIIV